MVQKAWGRPTRPHQLRISKVNSTSRPANSSPAERRIENGTGGICAALFFGLFFLFFVVFIVVPVVVVPVVVFVVQVFVFVPVVVFVPIVVFVFIMVVFVVNFFPGLIVEVVVDFFFVFSSSSSSSSLGPSTRRTAGSDSVGPGQGKPPSCSSGRVGWL